MKKGQVRIGSDFRRMEKKPLDKDKKKITESLVLMLSDGVTIRLKIHSFTVKGAYHVPTEGKVVKR